MDSRKCMIVDLEQEGDRRFLTERVTYIKKNENGHWSVCFATSPRPYRYGGARLLYLMQPETICLEEKGLYIHNKRVANVAELLRFTDRKHTYYRVTYASGRCECLDGSKVYVTRTPIDKDGGSTWYYLRKLAEETGLQTEDGEKNFLSIQYDRVDLNRDNVPIVQYLGNKRDLATYPLPQMVFYPFGCNASQKEAVEAALTHQVSIIQGPPGTGKTQTILNIAANLLMADKTVLVVSNNNSAIENVAEKLQREGLGFVVAQLGSVKNREEFVVRQEPCYPDMAGWALEAPPAVMKRAMEALWAVEQRFEYQTEAALIKAEYDALMKEVKYNDLLEKEMAIPYPNGWKGLSSAKLMRLLNLCQFEIAQSQKLALWFRIKCLFSYGFHTLSFFRAAPQQAVSTLERLYYEARKSEIERELSTIGRRLEAIDLKQKVKELTESSLKILKNKMSKRYSGATRQLFAANDIRRDSEKFLREYPVVLSTTYSAKSCISSDMVFDYVIMDEASQVDIKTGALALTCAMNAVIVGDDKQLPNIVSQEEALALAAIQSRYNVDERYNSATHSFLQSCTEIFKEAPTTLLREHYRCHPKIIEFCNQRFYDGELVAMTADSGEEQVLHMVRTVKGNHAREHLNQREIDVIVHEVMPQYANRGSVGIITPYRDQARAINEVLGEEIASTVHKYQGRECDTIIMSMVDNVPTSFSDDANLLNVAISRAKARLCVVTTGNEMPIESNLAQLADYILYNNFEVKESRLHSVFDLLYTQYTKERQSYLAKQVQVSDHLSENLLFNTLNEALAEMGRNNLSVFCHYPLYRLIADKSLLTSEERTFVESPLAHVDFLVYNSLTKRPLVAIEVDGWHFHKENEVQQSRDSLKDGVLAKYALALHRISTTDIVTVERMKAMMASSM